MQRSIATVLFGAAFLAALFSADGFAQQRPSNAPPLVKPAITTVKPSARSASKDSANKPKDETTIRQGTTKIPQKHTTAQTAKQKRVCTSSCTKQASAEKAAGGWGNLIGDVGSPSYNTAMNACVSKCMTAAGY